MSIHTVHTSVLLVYGAASLGKSVPDVSKVPRVSGMPEHQITSSHSGKRRADGDCTASQSYNSVANCQRSGAAAMRKGPAGSSEKLVDMSTKLHGVTYKALQLPRSICWQQMFIFW